MTQRFTVVIEKDEDGWLVSDVVELPGCHTQAKSLDQLMERTREAIMAWLEGEEQPAEEQLSPCENGRREDRQQRRPPLSRTHPS